MQNTGMAMSELLHSRLRCCDRRPASKRAQWALRSGQQQKAAAQSGDACAAAKLRKRCHSCSSRRHLLALPVNDTTRPSGPLEITWLD